MNTRKLHPGFGVEVRGQRLAEVRAVWPNPQNGEAALYIAAHICGVEGMDDDEGAGLIEELMEFATQPQYLYRHAWRTGEVLIRDERATLHRGCPWPYAEPRRLHSVCISAGPADGLELVRLGWKGPRTLFHIN